MLHIKAFGGTALVAALASFGVLVGANSAVMAQQSSNTVETITVIAPYITHQKAPANAKGTVFTVQSAVGTVSYADLDLSKPSGGTTLKYRVSEAAKILCGQLKAKYPEAVYVPVSSADCTKTAISETMETVDLLLAAYAKP